MEIDYDRISLAALDFTFVVCGDVECELEAGGIGAIECCGGEVSVEGGCWG